ncbi:acyltransferase family protein [Sphingomonas hengshuiensis]|uniref:acyltransferase family protein n=1 Tax=Sphingomonas hengshuiensis TaxID=1609977 RepID=UPI000698D61D|nr:acyltransferase family protein [Sphingomonas hengshuiensis]
MLNQVQHDGLKKGDATLAPPARRARHYGLDWLRIAAFALLILYHIAMVFAPWDWVIKTNHSYAALIPPMAVLTPWRLPLLFAVSGYASRALLDRSGSAGAFARSRAARLLVPLAFGMAVLVPLEMWVRVMEGGYRLPYLHFWAYDYWRRGVFYGVIFPSWEHLWFVAYLAAYSFVLSAALAWRGAGVLRGLDRGADWLAVGYRILWAPALVLAVLRLALLFVVPERQGLVSDWGGHSQYVPQFLFGFALAGAPQLWPALARAWKPALAVAAIAAVPVLAVEIAYPGAAVPSHAVMALDRAARSAMAWSMIVALFQLADRWWNRDHRWRRPLAEAVFPFYLVHHPAIVLIAWYTLPLGLPPLGEFALLLTGTALACVAAYAVGGRIGWVRPLIGLRPRLAAGVRSARETQATPGVP